jgi:hypothetical protein
MKYNLSNRSTLKINISAAIAKSIIKAEGKKEQLTILGIPTVKYRPCFSKFIDLY